MSTTEQTHGGWKLSKWIFQAVYSAVEEAHDIEDNRRCETTNAA